MHGFVFNLDPAIFHIGPFQLRYYSVIFAATLLIGYFVWKRQMLRGGYRLETAQAFLMYGFLAVVIGARLGHVLFYDPVYYFHHPLQILELWHGGLASHGATIGLIFALWLFARRHHVPLLDIMDRLAMSVAIGAAMVRLGNFFNSEIVGRATDVPWGVRFMYYDNGAVLRHPSQLYEFVMGLIILLLLWLADRKAGKENRPVGMMSGLFLTTYFLGRFFVEFFKEYQALAAGGLTMGQYLSIPPFLAGVALLWWSLIARRKAGAPEAERAAA